MHNVQIVFFNKVRSNVIKLSNSIHTKFFYLVSHQALKHIFKRMLYELLLLKKMAQNTNKCRIKIHCQVIFCKFIPLGHFVYTSVIALLQCILTIGFWIYHTIHVETLKHRKYPILCNSQG